MKATNEASSSIVSAETGDAKNQTEGQRLKQMKEYLRQTLGEDYFCLCDDFFTDIRQSDAVYKVCMARRCMNLMYLFMQCHEDSAFDIGATPAFYSDGALEANVKEIAEFYRLHQVFPSIMLIDDVLIHGRAINTLINRLIAEIAEYCSSIDAACYLPKLQEDILHAIQIRVIVQSDHNLLLYGRYQNLLSAQQVWPAYRWRDFSMRVSRVFACGGVANTSFVPSLYEYKLQPDMRMGEATLALDKTLGAHGFIKLAMNNRYQHSVWVRFLTDRQGGIVNIYTMRAKVGDIDGFDVFTPFMFFADISTEKGHLTERIKDLVFAQLDAETRRESEAAIDYWENCPRVCGELLCFILCQNFLLLSLQGLDTSVWQDAIDYDKISLTFHSGTKTPAGELYRYLQSRTTPWFDWETMDNILLALTEGSRPLVMTDLFNGSEQKLAGESLEEVMTEIIGDTFSNLGEEAEYHAYRQFLGEEFLSGQNHSKILFRELLQKNINTTGSFDQADLAQFVSCALRHMDIGVMAVTILHDTKEQTECFACCSRAGEPSLFVLPKRYALYLPILVAMERDNPGNDEMLYKRIRTFFGREATPELADKLVEFVQKLYKMGQHLFDWDFDLLGWVETEEPYLAQERRKGEPAEEPLTVLIRRAQQNILQHAYMDYVREC